MDFHGDRSDRLTFLGDAKKETLRCIYTMIQYVYIYISYNPTTPMHHFLKRKMSHGSKAKKLSEWSSSWWLKQPSEKYAQAKLENLSLIFGLWKCKKYLRFHHLDFRMIPFFPPEINGWPNVTNPTNLGIKSAHFAGHPSKKDVSNLDHFPNCTTMWFKPWPDLIPQTLGWSPTTPWVRVTWTHHPKKGHENAEFSRHLIQLLSISHIFQLTQSASRTKFDFWIKGILTTPPKTTTPQE